MMIRLKQILFVAIVLFQVACTQGEGDKVTQEAIEAAFLPEVVSLEEAQKLAQKLATTPNKQASGTKEIAEINTVQEGNIPVMYIFQYKNEEGFAVISAERKVQAVLAYSTEGDFSEEDMPLGVSTWIEAQKATIYAVRTGEVKAESAPDTWEKTARKSTKEKEVRPLTTTRWGQGCGYNAACPEVENAAKRCGRAPAGCVAVAMAQVMAYYQHPNTYNWEAMPNYYGTAETARLMRDIGDAVDMEYTSAGSSSSVRYGAYPAFADDFQYDPYSIYYQYYSFSKNRISEKVVTELDEKRIVMFAGYHEDEEGEWIGHAWVCDGYRREINEPEEEKKLYLHMNWGWNGKYNGWFLYNDFLIDGKYNFDITSSIITGLQPKIIKK